MEKITRLDPNGVDKEDLKEERKRLSWIKRLYLEESRLCYCFEACRIPAEQIL